MKLYHISNATKFKGSVDVVYHESKLMKVEFSNCDLEAFGLNMMMKAIPASEENLTEAFQSKDTIVVQGDFDISFDDFMREFPYKRNTHLARDFWPKMKKHEQAQAFVAASDYRKFLEREVNQWRTPMIPDKWLKTKQYLNDWKNL